MNDEDTALHRQLGAEADGIARSVRIRLKPLEVLERELQTMARGLQKKLDELRREIRNARDIELAAGAYYNSNTKDCPACWTLHDESVAVERIPDDQILPVKRQHFRHYRCPKCSETYLVYIEPGNRAPKP